MEQNTKGWLILLVAVAAITAIGAFAPQWVTNVVMIIGLLVVIGILGGRMDQHDQTDDSE